MQADIAVVGGGFAAFATLAHLVRHVESHTSIIAIAPDGFATFGTAYATPREEHLLNVCSNNMGLYADNKTDFHSWAENSSPDDYLPRKLFGQYLAARLQDTLAEAKSKSVDVTIIADKAVDVTAQGHVTCEKHAVSARHIVLAVGNSFVPFATPRVTDNPWHYDFAHIPAEGKSVAVIGTGLTAVDVLVSLAVSGYKGKITTYSGNGHLPAAHPPGPGGKPLPAFDPAPYMGKRLSHILHQLRAAVRALPEGEHWTSIIYALRPYTPAIWASLSTADKKRGLTKYLWLWNMHRHRYAAPIAPIIQQLFDSGQLHMKRGRVGEIREGHDSIQFEIKHPFGTMMSEAFWGGFKCIGPSFRTDAQPLFKRLVHTGVVKAHETGFGLAVKPDYTVGDNIWALGSCLVGAYLETIAVPEIRATADIIARDVAKRLHAAKAA